jgi:hypothetical protein
LNATLIGVEDKVVIDEYEGNIVWEYSKQDDQNA